METFRLLDTGQISAAANMALDKIILEEVAAYRSPKTLRFLQFKPAAALVGYHQDVTLEIREDFCHSNGISINRRLTGGGAIFFQETALGWELFGRMGENSLSGPYERILEKICRIAASGISQLGIPALFRPRNDIEVNGKKISGTGGVTISGAFMFQGTLLIENQVETFLKALRVPVEKLKKREIESLMDRMCFLADLVKPCPSIDFIKKILAQEFSKGLSVGLLPTDLTVNEKQRLSKEIGFFDSPAWIMSRSRPSREGHPIRSITQTEAGTIRVHLWLAPGSRVIRQALIVGDFFAVPSRVIHDLEAALVGVPAEADRTKKAVLSFFDQNEGRIIGLEPKQIAAAVAAAAERLLLSKKVFTNAEANELFLLNVHPKDLRKYKPKWLLLPYCSKNIDCDYREIPGCGQCGQCEISECYDLAKYFGMDPITVQSFEHLMSVLRYECIDRDGMYVGSCCEAFYSKHQIEMESTQARGILVNLDSTTCYDLGKGSQAYRGRFDNKTSLNMGLISKTLQYLHDSEKL